MRILNQTEDQTDQLAVGHCGTPTVPKVERRVDLDTQSGRLKVVIGVFDARNNALRDGEFRSTGRVAVDIHVVLDPGQLLGEWQGAAFFKKGFVVELQNRQVHPWCHGFDSCGNVARRLIRLYVNLAGVFDHVRIGKDAFAVDDDSGTLYLLGAVFAPGAEQVRGLVNRMYFDDQITDTVLGL